MFYFGDCYKQYCGTLCIKNMINVIILTRSSKTVNFWRINFKEYAKSPRSLENFTVCELVVKS